MGLVDGLLGNMVRESTGFDPRTVRKLTRGVGLKHLLVLGGAAALAINKAGPASTAPPTRSGGATGSRTQMPSTSGGPAFEPPPGETPGRASGPSVTPPPPPPPPGARSAPPPPPPPPAPTEAEASDGDPEEVELPPEAAVPALRTMIAAALADGEMGEQERSMVLDHIEAADLPEDQVQRLRQDLVLPPGPTELARMAPAPEARETLYRLAAVVLMADGQATETERRWLGRLAEAFEIAEERKEEMEREMFDGA